MQAHNVAENLKFILLRAEELHTQYLEFLAIRDQFSADILDWKMSALRRSIEDVLKVYEGRPKLVF